MYTDTRKKKVGVCRWVSTIQDKDDGSIKRCKTRLVVKGYTQTYGIDYSYTFIPVRENDIIIVMFSMSVNKD